MESGDGKYLNGWIKTEVSRNGGEEICWEGGGDVKEIVKRQGSEKGGQPLVNWRLCKFMKKNS